MLLEASTFEKHLVTVPIATLVAIMIPHVDVALYWWQIIVTDTFQRKQIQKRYI